MLRIEVTSTVNVKEVTKRSTQERFSIPEQVCWAHLPGDPHPTRVIRSVGKGQKPLEAGTYELDVSSIYVDRYGQLAIKQQFAVRPISGASVSPLSAPKAARA